MRFRNYYQSLPPFSQLLLVILLVTFGMMLSLLISTVIMKMSGIPLSHFGSVDDPQVLPWLKAMQLIQSLFVFILPPLLLMGLLDRESFCASAYQRPCRFSMAWILGVMVFLIPWTNLLVNWNEHIHLPASWFSVEVWMQQKEELAQKLTDGFLSAQTPGGLLINIFIMCVLAGVGEELLFRGALQPLFIRCFGNVHIGILVTAFLFSAIHLQFYGFFPRWLLGIFFGYLVIWSGSLWLSVWAHFLNNFFAVLFSWQIARDIWPESLETVGSTLSDWPILLGSLMFVMMGIRKMIAHQKSASLTNQ